LQWSRESLYELQSAQEQLADHYSYAADLSAKLDECVERSETRDDAVDGIAARLPVVEEELNETAADLEETISCLRYGLMESASGFVRFSTLSREQRSHMLVQERGNFAIWPFRNTAATTNSVHVPEQHKDDGEEAEEETLENDATVEQSPSGGATFCWKT